MIMAVTKKASTYTKVLRKAQKETAIRLDKALQATAVEGITRMINLTPVDTGAAKYHWFVRARPNENFNKENVDGSGKLPIARAKRDVKLFRTIMILYLVNAAPYFKYLEDGSSKQAPNGIVGITRASLHLVWQAAIKVAFSRNARTAPSGQVDLVGP